MQGGSLLTPDCPEHETARERRLILWDGRGVKLATLLYWAGPKVVKNLEFGTHHVHRPTQTAKCLAI